jgi:PadR family transcriptional regulator, regulatory protein AphA
MLIEYAILGLLSLNALSGYDIKKMFAGSPALSWSGNNNQIYKSLLKLHELAWVSRETQVQDSSPTRKIYSITDAGREALRRWVLSNPDMPQIKNPFLIQLAWADLLNPDELDNLLERYEDEISVQLIMLTYQKERLNLSPSGIPRNAYINVSAARTPRETFLWTMILENWLSYYQSELNWVKNLRAESKKL